MEDVASEESFQHFLEENESDANSDILIQKSKYLLLQYYDLKDEELDIYKDFEVEELQEESVSETTIHSEDIKKKRLSSFWSKVVLFAFNDKWNWFILATVVVYYMFIIYDFKFVTRTTEVRIFIPLAMDVLYFYNIMLHIIYKEWKTLNKMYTYSVYENWHVAIACLSCLPVDLIILMAEGLSIKSYVLSWSRINRVLRIIGIILHFRTVHNRVSQVTLFIILFEWLCHFLILSNTFAAIIVSFICFEEDCWATHIGSGKMLNFDWYIATLLLLMAPMTNSSFPTFVIRRPVDMLIYIFVSVISFFLMMGYILGYLTSTLDHQKRNTYLFRSTSTIAKNYMIFHRVNEGLQQKAEYYYETLAKRREEFKELDFLEILPLGLVKEIKVDLCWATFKHTHLFRNMDMAFLQVLALKMVYKFCMPGDIIYNCKGYKREMVYVIAGHIQIESEADEETPIISLTAGTCLGSSALLLGYHSNTAVRCSTCCQLIILKHQSFVSVLKDYPELRKMFLKQILDMYRKAKELNNIAKLLREHNRNMERGIGQTDMVTSIRWIKDTMKKLMKGEEVSDSGVHLNNVQFTAMNLDLYALSEEIDLVTDPICLRSIWPWILQPKSQLLSLWNSCILIITAVSAILIPYYATLVCTPMKYNEDPNMVPDCHDAKNAIILQVTTMIFFTLDVIVQILTAVRLKDVLLSDWKQILPYRITCFGFIIDIIAALPLELLASLCHSRNNVVLGNAFSLNRLLKLWKWEHFAQSLENSLQIDLMVVRFLKIAVYVLLLVYYVGCILYATGCFSGYCTFNSWIVYQMTDIKSYEKNTSAHYFDPKTTPWLHVWRSMYFSWAMFSGHSHFSARASNTTETLTVLIIVIASNFVFLYIIAILSATQNLKNKNLDIFKDTYREVKNLMKIYKLKRDIQEDLMGAMQTKWQYFHGILLSDNVDVLPSDSTALRDIKVDMFTEIFRNIPLFKGLSTKFHEKVAKNTDVSVIAPNQLVVVTGEVTKRMYIIMDGYCEVLSNKSGLRLKVIGPKDHFGAVEIFLKISNVSTVRTITHCRFAIINETWLWRIISMFPIVNSNINFVIASFSSVKELKKFQGKQQAYKPWTTEKFKTKVSFIWIGYGKMRTSKKRSEKSVNKAGGRKKEGYFRFILLPFTFHPEGLFIKCWELSRVFLIYIGCIIVPTRFILFLIFPNISKFFIQFLDLMAYIDILIRLHVCYYNDIGILVKDPLKTSMYYIKHAFALDFIACFPWELLLESRKGIFEYENFKLMRILQCHRIFEGFVFLEGNISNLHLCNFIRIYKYIPMIFCFICIFAALLCVITCEFTLDTYWHSKKIYGGGVICSNISWIQKSVFANTDKTGFKLTPLRVYLYAMYWMCSCMTLVGYEGINFQTQDEYLFEMGLSFLGFLFYVYILATVISTKALQNVDLTSYQEKMHTLVRYMLARKVHSELQREVVEYFELKWLKKKGRNVHQILTHFDICLREAVLYNIYGAVLHEVAGSSFIRHMLEHCYLTFFIKHAVIININDVVNETYFLFRGRIDVSGPEGSRLLTLHRGAIIGNLDDKSYTRQTLMMEARSHVECITIKTNVFYEILEGYPYFKSHFESCIEVNRDFLMPLLGNPEEIKHDEEQSQSQSQSYSTISGSGTLHSSRSTITAVLTGRKIFSKNRKWYKIWEVCILIAGAYVNFMFTSYQAAMIETDISLMIFQYFMDLMYVLKIYIKLHTAFEDEYGDVITDVKLIAKRYMQEKCGLFLDIFTTFPFEILAAVFSNRQSWNFLTTFVMLRLNRLGRIVFVFQYFKINSNKLNINVFWRRCLFLLLFVAFLLHLLTCFDCILVLFTKQNLAVPDHHHWTTERKMHKYLVVLDVSVSYMMGGSTKSFMPFETWVVAVGVIMSIIMEFINLNIIANMCSILEVTSYTKSLYAHKIANMKGYLHIHDLSPALLNQVWEYMVLLWDYLRGIQFPVLLAEAPYNLIENVKTSLFGIHIYSNYVFCTCQTDFLRQLMRKVKQYSFFPGNPIAHQNEINDCMYFIYKGEVEVLIEGKDLYNPELHDILKTGDMFGVLQGLYPRYGHTNSYRARTRTIILVLYRPDWEYLLEFFPDSKEELYDRANTLQYTV